MKKSKIKKIALSALFTAIIAVTAWVSVPTPFGVNFTFSILGVALTGFCLGVKGALAATVSYIVLGAAGLPIFSGFLGGIGILLGPSGGFIWGFLAVAVLCGIAKKINKKSFKYTLMSLSIVICHIAGILQYSIVTGNGLLISMVTISTPFLLKDFAIVFLSEIISKKIKI